MSRPQSTDIDTSDPLSSASSAPPGSGSGVGHILSQLARAFGSLPHVRKAFLFGSRSREDHEERDDIDIAVSCPQATDEQWAQIERFVNGLPTLLRVDLVRLERTDLETRLNIQSEGILFFEPWGRRWSQFCEALDRLGRGLESEPSDELDRDGILHRFARCVDLFHKLLRRLLWSKGLSDQGLKDALVLAYQQGWIQDEDRWLSLLQARFWVERAYDDSRIVPLVEKIVRHHALLLQARESLKERFELE